MTKLTLILRRGAAILCLLAVVWLAVENIPVFSSLSLFGQQFSAVSVGGFIVGILFLSIVGTVLAMMEQVELARKGSRKAERNLEKAEVTAESSAEKVKALEAKILTLEKALEKALERTVNR